MMNKQTIFSGMQATGAPHLGNYIGAIKNWISLQQDYSCLYSIVDLHSITIRQEPEKLRQHARNLFISFVALGINPEKTILYYQSHVPAHAELAWLLSCYTYLGELNRMTQFKDKSKKNADNINAGLFTYPILQAADILLYKANLVPVGEDQKQHLELTRDIAERFNHIYGDVFVVPEPYISTTGARIMGLQEPSKKMSKSEGDNENNIVYLLDSPDIIMKKFKRAVTDSENRIAYDPDNKPGVSNLLSIYAAAVGSDPEKCAAELGEGAGYGTLKTRTGEAVAEMLAPFRERYTQLCADAGYIDKAIAEGAKRANEMAAETIFAVKKVIGFPE